MDLKEFLRRIGQIIIVLIGVSFFTFLLVQLAPGDPVMTMYQSMGIIPTEEVLNETREAMGLNDPFFVQYFRWLANVLKGDLGMSYSKYRPVASLLAGRMWPTLKLSISSMFVMLLFAVPLGMISAVYSNKPIDYIVLRSRAPTSENCRVRGMGVALMVSVSTLVFIWRNFSFVETPNFCSSSMMSSPKSLNFTLLPMSLCVPIRMSIFPSARSFRMAVVCLVLRARDR